jgi:hypothetical protein
MPGAGIFEYVFGTQPKDPYFSDEFTILTDVNTAIEANRDSDWHAWAEQHTCAGPCSVAFGLLALPFQPPPAPAPVPPAPVEAAHVPAQQLTYYFMHWFGQGQSSLGVPVSLSPAPSPRVPVSEQAK